MGGKAEGEVDWKGAHKVWITSVETANRAIRALDRCMKSTSEVALSPDPSWVARTVDEKWLIGYSLREGACRTVCARCGEEDIVGLLADAPEEVKIGALEYLGATVRYLWRAIEINSRREGRKERVLLLSKVRRIRERR